MTFDDIEGEISQVEIIAKGRGVNIRHYLNQKYGRGDCASLRGWQP